MMPEASLQPPLRVLATERSKPESEGLPIMHAGSRDGGQNSSCWRCQPQPLLFCLRPHKQPPPKSHPINPLPWRGLFVQLQWDICTVITLEMHKTQLRTDSSTKGQCVHCAILSRH